MASRFFQFLKIYLSRNQKIWNVIQLILLGLVFFIPILWMVIELSVFDISPFLSLGVGLVIFGTTFLTLKKISSTRIWSRAFCGSMIVLISVFILFLIPFGLLRKTVPSIHERVAPHCASGIDGKYITPENLPEITEKVFVAAEPDYKWFASRFLNEQLQGKKQGMAKWHERGVLLNLWIRQFNEADLITYSLNRAYFGLGCYGVDAAAQNYFKKDIGHLNVEETAKLIAMLKSPNEMQKHPEENKKAADKILEKLAAH